MSMGKINKIGHSMRSLIGKLKSGFTTSSPSTKNKNSILSSLSQFKPFQASKPTTSQKNTLDIDRESPLVQLKPYEQATFKTNSIINENVLDNTIHTHITPHSSVQSNSELPKISYTLPLPQPSICGMPIPISLYKSIPMPMPTPTQKSQNRIAAKIYEDFAYNNLRK